MGCFASQTGLPAKQTKRLARGRCTGLASSPLGPVNSAGPQASTAPAPGPFLPAAEGNPWGTVAPQPGPCRGRPWAWVEEGGVPSFRARGSWHCRAPLASLQGSCSACASLRTGPPASLGAQAGPPTASGHPNQPPGSSREANFHPQGCEASLPGLFRAPRVGCPALRYGDARPLPALRASESRAPSWDSDRSRNVHPAPSRLHSDQS